MRMPKPSGNRAALFPSLDAELATMEIFTEIDDLVIGDPNL